MTGEELIHSMPVKAIEKAFGVSRSTAINIKNKDKQGLIHSCHTCPQLLNLKTKWPCNFRETSCKECMKNFLENEIPETLPTIKESCINCIELDFCQGLFPCAKLKEDKDGESK